MASPAALRHSPIRAPTGSRLESNQAMSPVTTGTSLGSEEGSALVTDGSVTAGDGAAGAGVGSATSAGGGNGAGVRRSVASATPLIVTIVAAMRIVIGE